MPLDLPTVVRILCTLACVFPLVAADPDILPAHRFLDRVQQAAFEYFWKEANPANGLVRDRSREDSKCSVAAVGFGLSAVIIGIEHGWVSRDEGRARVLRVLETLFKGAQGATPDGVNGYRGWFYHFLEMDSGLRAWKCELSSIDTALLLAGVLDAGEFFDGAEREEGMVRDLARALVGRVDWTWMTDGGETFLMGWHPETGFLKSRWIGYNEGMILNLLALGSHPGVGSTSRKEAVPIRWEAWTSGYRWRTNSSPAFVEFAPLFGHQYSHCWVDFRGIADPYMRARGLTYFENSRRATLAQQAYCVAQAGRYPNYGPHEWGLTACDGPDGYSVHGAPPEDNDDGTLAPTAVGGSLPFAPEICLPTMMAWERKYRDQLWGPYGFRDAFNIQRNWWASDTLGIDQGPILLMAENYRTGAVWRRMKKNPVIRRGLERAGFRPVLESPSK